MCKDGECLECMTIDRNQLSDYLDKIARFLIDSGSVKTDDMVQEEVPVYVVEAVTALRERVAEMKTDLAKCFMELYDSSFPFADDLAEKYYDSWNEIREAANSQ